MYIINSAGIAYHQHEVLYIIKPQVDARWRVMKSSPKGADDIHDCVVMICQAYGNPQSSSSSLWGTPTAAWIKKFDKSKLVEFFEVCNKDLNSHIESSAITFSNRFSQLSRNSIQILSFIKSFSPPAKSLSDLPYVSLFHV